MADTLDLRRFKEEVSDKGLDKSLPMNLSDYWLDYLLAIAECFQDGEWDNAGFSVMTAAILDILTAKSGNEELSLSFEELLDYFQQYGVELGLESVARKTEVKYDPATIETIFRNRDVKITIRSCAEVFQG